MTISYTTHFRFGLPDFLAGPWHNDWYTLVRLMDEVLYELSLSTILGTWANSTAYVPGNVRIDPDLGTIWVCLIVHTSAVAPTTFAADRVAHSTYWAAFPGQPTFEIALPIDGNGSVLTVGTKIDVPIAFSFVINSWTLVADQVGSLVIDIWKDTYGNYPPTIADTITAAAKPTLTAANKNSDTLLTGWIKSVTAGDTLRFNIDSASIVQRATLVLSCTKT